MIKTKRNYVLTGVGAQHSSTVTDVGTVANVLNDQSDDSAAATFVFEGVRFGIVDFLHERLFSFGESLLDGFNWILRKANFINDKSV